MINRFRPYNTSMLVSVFMSSEHKIIWKNHFIPNYDDINNKDDDSWTALMWVAAFINVAINITRLLLNHPGIDVNIKNWYGNTALYIAIYFKHTKIINLLKQYNAK